MIGIPQDGRVGLLGLGTMGRLFAGHLADAYASIHVHDKNTTTYDYLDKERCGWQSTPSELASAVDYLVVSLPDPGAAQEAFLGADGVLAGARQGLVILDLSTIDPTTAGRLYTSCKAAGVVYVEAPLSGGEPASAGINGARHANVTFMVGAAPGGLEAVEPLMRVLGKRWFHLGEPGSGARVKIISNLISGVYNLVLVEAFTLGEAMGIDPQTLNEVFDGTDAKSYWLTDYLIPRVRDNDYENGFSIRLQHKDHMLAHQLEREFGVSLATNHMALYLYQQAIGAGRGNHDVADMMNHMRQVLKS